MVESVSFPKPLVKNNKTTYKSMSTLNVFGNNSLILFHSGLHNEKTQSCYDNYLRYFKDFFLLKTYDNLLEYDVKTIQKMIQDYVMYQRSKGQSHGSISGNLSALKLFYEMNDNNQNYSEELIYSFEELMHIQLNSHKICEHKYFYSQLKFKTALSCKTITSFC